MILFGSDDQSGNVRTSEMDDDDRDIELIKGNRVLRPDFVFFVFPSFSLSLSLCDEWRMGANGGTKWGWFGKKEAG